MLAKLLWSLRPTIEEHAIPAELIGNYARHEQKLCRDEVIEDCLACLVNAELNNYVVQRCVRGRSSFYWLKAINVATVITGETVTDTLETCPAKKADKGKATVMMGEQLSDTLEICPAKKAGKGQAAKKKVYTKELREAGMLAVVAYLLDKWPVEPENAILRKDAKADLYGKGKAIGSTQVFNDCFSSLEGKIVKGYEVAKVRKGNNNCFWLKSVEAAGEETEIAGEEGIDAGEETEIAGEEGIDAGEEKADNIALEDSGEEEKADNTAREDHVEEKADKGGEAAGHGTDK